MAENKIRKVNSTTLKPASSPNAAGIGYDTDKGTLVLTDGAASKYIGQEFVIAAPLLAASVDAPIFIAPFACEVTGIQHVVSTGAAGATLAIKKCTGTTAPASGTAIHATTLALDATVNTVTTKAPNTDGSQILAAGDRLAQDLSGTLTNLVGNLTLTLKRV